MICGYSPFFGEKASEIIANVKNIKYDFDEVEWDSIDSDVKDLISKMICP